MTQTNEIASILKQKGQIDNFYAIQNFISLRLGARIHDLRAMGWDIETEKNWNGTKNTNYKLIKAV